MNNSDTPPAGKPAGACSTPNPSRLSEQVRNAIRLRHYSIRTEQSYLDWIKRFILFHHKKHPKEMGAPEVERFLSRNTSQVIDS